MEPFRRHTGRVAALPRANVDTDQIIPKQFLKRIERTGFGAVALLRLALSRRRHAGPGLRAESARGRGRQRAARRRELRLRLVARARAVGAGGVRIPRHRRALVRRHLLRQLLPERAAAGGPGRGGRGRAVSPGRRGVGRLRAHGGSRAHRGARRGGVRGGVRRSRRTGGRCCSTGWTRSGARCARSRASPRSSGGARSSWECRYDALHGRGAARRRHRARGDRGGAAGPARGGGSLRLSDSTPTEYAVGAAGVAESRERAAGAHPGRR